MITWKETDHKVYKYELQEEVGIEIGHMWPPLVHEYFCIDLGILLLKKGYAIDGVTSWFDFDGLMPGAFVHDALLQAIGLGLMDETYRKHTHEHFYKNCDTSTTLKKVSARVAYTGLEVFHDLWKKLT